MKKPAKPKKRFSFPFLISIPANFILATIFLFTIIDLIATHGLDIKSWSIFGLSFISALTFISCFKITRFRVFIHEFKHSMLVNLSGNKVKDFKVGKETGHVEFAMYQDRVHFAPLIALAPYFFPLFSLPTFIASLFLRTLYPELTILALGLTLAIDLSFSIHEIHPYQTDFQGIIGGFFVSALYLGGFYVMWSFICTISAIFGHEAFLHSFYIAIDIGEKIWWKLQ